MISHNSSKFIKLYLFQLLYPNKSMSIDYIFSFMHFNTPKISFLLNFVNIQAVSKPKNISI